MSWTVEVAIDPAWFAVKGVLAEGPCPPPAVAVWALGSGTSRVGRTSEKKGVTPELPLDGDPGVSRRHAEFVVAGDKLFVVDRSSANGTYVFAPNEPYGGETRRIEPGVAGELRHDDRVYLGAWTRLTVRWSK